MRHLVMLVLFMLPLSGYAGVERVEISPSVMVNLAEGHSGTFMGGALTGDVFFARGVAIRTTIGLTKSRYYPAELDYNEADYGFWLSFAPYIEMFSGERVRPYLAVLGTFSTSGEYAGNPGAPAFGLDRAPVSRLQYDARDQSFYSLGLSLGSKFQVVGPVSVFGEFTHYFFSSISDDVVYFGPELGPFGREYDFEHNPTYLSFGLSYSFEIQ